MREARWRLQDAKTQFSQVVEAALQGNPQHVTRRGHEAVVVLSAASYRALQDDARSSAPGLIAHLLAIPKSHEPITKEKTRRIALRDVDV